MSKNTGTALSVSGDEPFAPLRTRALEIGIA
jgi:hypothetical protein